MIELYIQQYSEYFTITNYLELNNVNTNVCLESKKICFNIEKGFDVAFLFLVFDSPLLLYFVLDFTNFLISRMLRILLNPDIKSLHSNSTKIIILILETFSVSNHFDFFSLVSEIILSLEGRLWFLFSELAFNLIYNLKTLDLVEFDKEFYDKNEHEPKTLKRFNIEFDQTNPENEHNEMLLNKKNFIIIETPQQCSSLQENLT